MPGHFLESQFSNYLRGAITIISFLLLFGCDYEKDKGNIKETVKKYSDLLANGYISSDMNPLVEVATEERVDKANYQVAAMAKARIKIDAKLHRMTFKEIRLLSNDRAKAQTVELWDHTHINVDSGKPVLSKTTEYTYTYLLAKKLDRWIVSKVSLEKEENIRQQKFR